MVLLQPLINRHLVYRLPQDRVHIRVYALFIRFGEECPDITQEIATAIESVGHSSSSPASFQREPPVDQEKGQGIGGIVIDIAFCSG